MSSLVAVFLTETITLIELSQPAYNWWYLSGIYNMAIYSVLWTSNLACINCEEQHVQVLMSLNRCKFIARDTVSGSGTRKDSSRRAGVRATEVCCRLFTKCTLMLITVTEALVLRPLLEDRGRITESMRILVPVDRMKQKCFQITTKQVRRSQQFQLHW